MLLLVVRVWNTLCPRSQRSVVEIFFSYFDSWSNYFFYFTSMNFFLRFLYLCWEEILFSRAYQNRAKREARRASRVARFLHKFSSHTVGPHTDIHLMFSKMPILMSWLRLKAKWAEIWRQDRFLNYRNDQKRKNTFFVHFGAFLAKKWNLKMVHFF